MRTIIYYDGEEYIVAEDADDVRARIDAILATGAPGWLAVNHGRGALQESRLLVSSGVAISLLNASDPGVPGSDGPARAVLEPGDVG